MPYDPSQEYYKRYCPPENYTPRYDDDSCGCMGQIVVYAVVAIFLASPWIFLIFVGIYHPGPGVVFIDYPLVECAILTVAVMAILGMFLWLSCKVAMADNTNWLRKVVFFTIRSAFWGIVYSMGMAVVVVLIAIGLHLLFDQ